MEPVVDAGLAHLRTVLVTVVATVGGLIPLARERGEQGTADAKGGADHDAAHC